MTSIKAISKSTGGVQNLQFVVHVKNEYDYFYESEHREQIMDALKYVYHLKFKANIPVYGVP